jgi:hypothetical protein
MKVSHIDYPEQLSLDEIGRLMDEKVKPFDVDVVNWNEFPYKPVVKVQFAYGDQSLVLKYLVQEKAVLARVTEPNGEVWTDSCVEFFLSPGGDDEYYNLEFNCIGTPLLRHNKDGEVTFGSGEIMSSIRTKSSLGSSAFNEKKGSFEWSLIVEIPLASFFKHNIVNLKGLRMKANFYKCGDGLSEPHFVSWTPIGTDSPSFHQPAFFGDVEFE